MELQRKQHCFQLQSIIYLYSMFLIMDGSKYLRLQHVGVHTKLSLKSVKLTNDDVMIKLGIDS